MLGINLSTSLDNVTISKYIRKEYQRRSMQDQVKVKLSNSSTNENIEVGRVIGDIGKEADGPTLVVFGGIHGNEPSGVFALNKVFEIIEKNGLPLNGRLVGLAGNLKALEQRKRYLSKDLNRLWTEKNMLRIIEGNLNGSSNDPDVMEQLVLFEKIRELLSTGGGPFYFIDLHTTSAESIPFITINDTLNNRGFALKFPTHVILGIEEFIDGPLLSFMNEIGHTSIGFEAGQHDALGSIENSYDLIWYSLHLTGLLDLKRAPRGNGHFERLKKAMGGSRMIHEVRDRFEVLPESHFKMKPGFVNFQKIDRGDVLAEADGREVRAKEGGRIFMPLYQEQGVDGYFLIRPVSASWLWLSRFLRKARTERLLRILPGVRKADKKSHTLVVDKRIAKFLATDIFHVLGYRRKRAHGHKLYFIRRSITHPELLAVQ